jgi:hypothetical protein
MARSSVNSVSCAIPGSLCHISLVWSVVSVKHLPILRSFALTQSDAISRIPESSGRFPSLPHPRTVAATYLSSLLLLLLRCRRLRARDVVSHPPHTTSSAVRSEVAYDTRQLFYDVKALDGLFCFPSEPPTSCTKTAPVQLPS